MRVLLTSLVAVLLLCLPTAMAAETGSPAWTLSDQSIYEGPGTEYNVLGSVPERVRVQVDRCTWRWCLIHGAEVRGWVYRGALTFGKNPNGPLSGPLLGYKSGGPGVVCLYEGRHYSGFAFCKESGAGTRDLLLYELDNVFSSVTIEGNVSVTLCRDRDFTSYCERVNESEPVLDGFLDNNVSSYQVH